LFCAIQQAHETRNTTTPKYTAATTRNNATTATTMMAGLAYLNEQTQVCNCSLATRCCSVLSFHALVPRSCSSAPPRSWLRIVLLRVVTPCSSSVFLLLVHLALTYVLLRCCRRRCFSFLLLLDCYHSATVYVCVLALALATNDSHRQRRRRRRRRRRRILEFWNSDVRSFIRSFLRSSQRVRSLTPTHSHSLTPTHSLIRE